MKLLKTTAAATVIIAGMTTTAFAESNENQESFYPVGIITLTNPDDPQDTVDIYSTSALPLYAHEMEQCKKESLDMTHQIMTSPELALFKKYNNLAHFQASSHVSILDNNGICLDRATIVSKDNELKTSGSIPNPIGGFTHFTTQESLKHTR